MSKKLYKNLSNKYSYKRECCSICGQTTTKHVQGVPICNKCLKMKSIDSQFSDEDLQLLKEIKKSNMTSKEFSLLSKHLEQYRPDTTQPYTCKQSHVKIGVISDTHIGSKFYDSQLMDEAAKNFTKNKVNFVVHAGDICEGHYENRRQGSVFELTELGGDAQVKRAVEELGKIKQPIYGITGNHEYNTFYRLCGFEIGEQLQDKLPNFHYLGNAKGVINLPFGQKMELIHPDGGTAYALSYKPQKIIEAMDGGTKPAIAIIGHFHKMEHLYYRNVHTFQAGCLQSQTTFMRNGSISAGKGYWILDVKVGKKGISSIKTEMFNAY